jgi:selenocysteine lyase/cysteine desulfurase
MKNQALPSESSYSDYAASVEVTGIGTPVPCLDGQQRPYINLDNAATTPPLREVADAVSRFNDWYSSVHRGTGYKSQLSTVLFEEARQTIGDFVGMDWEDQTLVLCQNTTEAINRVARRIELEPTDVILNTVIEHHANLLPWALTGQVVHFPLTEPGVGPPIQLESAEKAFREFEGRVKLLAVTGASNVTGCMPPIHGLAELAHRYGARIFVDAAQLLPHRAVDVRPADDPQHIDFLAFSGHKMYAPYGSGGLVAPRDFLSVGIPHVLGGGAVQAVRLDDVVWKDLPEREEAGTPNLVGVLALAKACQILSRVGMDAVAEHERALTRHVLTRLPEVPGLEVVGETDPEIPRDRVAVFSFNHDRFSHAELAAILGFEHGIAVRNGCFCAHPYVDHLAGLNETDINALWERIQRGDHTNKPGFVRASAGCYNTVEDFDALVTALIEISESGPKGDYREDPESGQFLPEGYSHSFEEMFAF